MALNKTTADDIELASLGHYTDLDVELIEEDAGFESASNLLSGSSFATIPDYAVEEQRNRPICYTPERLVRMQDYRILTPSPKFPLDKSSPDISSKSPSIHRDPNPRRSPKFRRKLEDLIDSCQIGASQLEAVLDPNAPEVRVPISLRHFRRLQNQLNAKNRLAQRAPTSLLDIANRKSPIVLDSPEPLISPSSSTCDCLCNSLTETEKKSSVDDTSGIQSNSWSESGSTCETRVCLSHELAAAMTASKCQHDDKGVINQVVSILEGLQTNGCPPSDVEDYQIQDRFASISSSHDYLTRLALSIEEEDDGLELPKHNNHSTEEKSFHELRQRIERLQENSKSIYRDIGLLRNDFQLEERKLDNLQGEATRLHHDINDLRYLDDLLNLLRGEMARISRRNWPFILGHDDYNNEEINLVV